VGILGISMLTVAALSGPATAQFGGGTWTAQPGIFHAAATPLQVDFTTLRCLKLVEGGPVQVGRPLTVLIFAADLRSAEPIAKISVERFPNVRSGETRKRQSPMWAPYGGGAPIGSVNDYIFLVAMMEWYTPSSVAQLYERELGNKLYPKLLSYKAAGMSRSAIAGNLRRDMDLAIEKLRIDGEYRVGGITELFFADYQLDQARAGTPVYESREFTTPFSKYLLTFRVQR
jgi:hypothetical protein